jgi:hypothetical protein
MISDVRIYRPGQPVQIIRIDSLSVVKKKKTYAHSKARNVGPRKHTCKTCQKTFSALGDRSYCHNPCKYVDKRHIPLKEQLRSCLDCRDLFTPVSSTQKRCNKPCRSVQKRILSVHYNYPPVCRAHSVNITLVTTTDQHKVTCGNCRKIK